MTNQKVSVPGVQTDSIANFVSGAGTYQDATMHARPVGMEGRLGQDELDNLYQYNDIARRIVDEKVEDALRNEFIVRYMDTNEIVEIPDNLNILEPVADAAKWGRAFGEGYVLMVEEYECDLSEPYVPGQSSRIVNLIDFDLEEVSPIEWNGKPQEPGYGDPSMYEIHPHTNASFDVALPAVHRSRLLRFSGNRLPRRLRSQQEDQHDSVLQVVWDALRRFLSTEQGIALLVQRFEQATISIAGLASVLAAEDGEMLIQRRMRIMHQSLTTLHAALVDKDAGEEYSRQYGSVQGLDTVWDRMANSVSKAAKMPMTLLFGLSAGGLSSDDEAGKANWRKQVTQYQMQDLGPQLTWLFYCITGRPVWIEWPAADETTPKEEAEIDKLHAEADAIRIGLGIYDALEVRDRLIQAGKLVIQAGPPPDPTPIDPAFVESDPLFLDDEDPLFSGIPPEDDDFESELFGTGATAPIDDLNLDEPVAFNEDLLL
jgi:phage-related protein (TIGR01555 family)